MGMSTASIILLLVFSLGASFTQRVTGFGFGIFIMAILPFIMPTYGEATALSGLLAIVCVVLTAIRMRKHLQWNKLLPILVTFLVVSFFAVKAVAMIDDHILKRVVGAILIAVSIYFFFFSERIHMKPTVPVQICMGTLSGLMGGFFAMQGPPAVIYFLSCTKTKEQYIALSSAYFVLGNCMMTLFRASSGFVTQTVGKAWLMAVPTVVIGIWLGGRVYDRIDVVTLRKIVYAFMAVSGLLALLS